MSMFQPPSPRQWPLMLLMLCLLCGGSLCFAFQLDLLDRAFEALSRHIQTELKQYRPTPVLPTPPASEIDPTMLLQAPPPTVSEANDFTQFLPTTTASPAFNIEERPVTIEPLSSPISVTPIQSQVTLSGFQHEWQKWNNCGPATIAMHLSYFGRTETQVEAAQFLKPNQDDKNVSPTELEAYAKSLGYETIIGVGGSFELLKQFLSNGLPIIVEFWTEPEDLGGMGHYRLLTGFESRTNDFIAQDSHFIVQDSLYGPNLTVSMAAFDKDWQVFNRLYLLIYQVEQTDLVQTILGQQKNSQVMVSQALHKAQIEAKTSPQNPFAWFNLGTNYFHLNQPDRAAAAFDEARRLGLPYRMLWYQFTLFDTYLAEERYQEVIDLATITLEGTGGLEELYYYRGLAYQNIGQVEAATADFQAVQTYNPDSRLPIPQD